MSALRIALPGQPIRLIPQDDGIRVRLSPQGYIVRGGPIEQAAVKRPTSDGTGPSRWPYKERCGRILKTGLPCVRPEDHVGHHQGRQW